MIPVPLTTTVSSSEVQKNISPDPQHVHVPPENKVPMSTATVPAYTAYPSPVGPGSAAPLPPYPAFPATQGSSTGYPPAEAYPT